MYMILYFMIRWVYLFYHCLNIDSILDLSNDLARTIMLLLTPSITHFPVIQLLEGKEDHKKLDAEIVR